MENTGIWVVAIIIIFVLGSILNLRTSPREKALGNLRETARKMGLNPRLVPAPEWLNLPKNGQYAPMIAYYHIIIPQGQYRLMHAVYDEQQHAKIIIGTLPESLTQPPVPIYGVEQQANSIGVYWDESHDLQGEKLTELKQWLDDFTHLASQK